MKKNAKINYLTYFYCIILGRSDYFNEYVMFIFTF